MEFFSFLSSPEFTGWERVALWSVLGIAVLGLLYAVFLAATILRKDQGTEKMRQISRAIRLGANAYLTRQLRAVVVKLGLSDEGALTEDDLRDLPLPENIYDDTMAI